MSHALVSELGVVGASADTCCEAPQRGGPEKFGESGVTRQPPDKRERHRLRRCS